MAKGKYEYWLTPEGLTKLAGWARSGMTEEQIAHNIGISRSTLNRWKSEHRDIWDTLKRGKEVVDLQVEAALLKRALGYDYYEETEERRFNRQSGSYEMIVTKRTKKSVLPDVTAQIFWMKNRMPDQWKDKQSVNQLSVVIPVFEGEDELEE